MPVTKQIYLIAWVIFVSNLCVVDAMACSVWIGPDSKKTLDHSAYFAAVEKVNAENFIGVVSVHLKKGGKAQIRKTENAYDLVYGNVIMREVEFRIIENFSGKPLKLQTAMFPYRDSAEPNATRQADIKDDTIGFSFWDAMPLDRSESQISGSSDSCGTNHWHTTMDINTPYLTSISKAGKIQFAYEIPEGDSRIVNAFKNHFNDSAESELDLTARDFFTSLNGYTHLKIKRCPGYMFGKLRIKGRVKTLSSFAETNSNETRVSFDFDNYEDYNYHAGNYRQNSRPICEIGQEVLVIYNSGITGNNTLIEPDRYLLVTDKRIDIQTIPTAFTIEGNRFTDIDSIKSWIRSGRGHD